MAKRRYGPLEERLRAEIKRLVGGNRGLNQKVAGLIGRPPPWLTEYRSGRGHANLDTSLQLMRVLGWSVNKELKDLTTPRLDPDLLAELLDEEKSAQALVFVKMKPELRAALLVGASAFPKGQRTPPLTAVSTRERKAAGRTKSE